MDENFDNDDDKAKILQTLRFSTSSISLWLLCWHVPTAPTNDNVVGLPLSALMAAHREISLANVKQSIITMAQVFKSLFGRDMFTRDVSPYSVCARLIYRPRLFPELCRRIAHKESATSR